MSCNKVASISENQLRTHSFHLEVHLECHRPLDPVRTLLASPCFIASFIILVSSSSRLDYRKYILDNN